MKGEFIVDGKKLKEQKPALTLREMKKCEFFLGTYSKNQHLIYKDKNGFCTSLTNGQQLGNDNSGVTNVVNHKKVTIDIVTK
jgi:hypothetical protein